MNNRRCSGHPQKMVPLALRRFQLGARIIIYVAKEHEKKPDEYWQHILWSKETKIKFVWIRRGPDCLVWTRPRPVTAHSADHEKEKWEGTNTRLRDRKTSRQDDLYRWCYKFLKNLRK